MSIKVLQVSSEVSPLIKTGGLADVVSGLSQALNKAGHDCRIVIPSYPFVDLEAAPLTKIDQFMFSVQADREAQVEVYQTTLPSTQTILYLIQSSIGFSSAAIYPTKDDIDQHRFIIFGLAVAAWLKRFDWQPDLIHAHDWMCGPILKQISVQERSYPSLLTIHNSKYQGEINSRDLDDLSDVFTVSRGKINMLNEALNAATIINTVSPTFAQEIHTAEFGYGIESIINQRSKDVSGIINGIDFSTYSTQNNPLVQPPYTPENAPQIKEIHKQAILRELQITDEEKPLFVVVGRTGSQKGMDVLADVLDSSSILERVNFVILVGRGTKRIEDLLERLGRMYSQNVKVILGFDDLYSHRLYAAADFIVMPSKYEPCGLSQLIGMRYGAVPVVRSTGGLRDTVPDISNRDGRGINYVNHDAASLLFALERAVELYKDKPAINKLITSNMKLDLSWDKPVIKYVDLYHQAIKSAKSQRYLR